MFCDRRGRPSSKDGNSAFQRISNHSYAHDPAHNADFNVRHYLTAPSLDSRKSAR